MSKEEITDLMSQDLELALSSLKKVVKRDSPFYKEIILSEGALNDLNSYLRKGLISASDILNEIGKLRHRVLLMIEAIPESHFISNELETTIEKESELGIFDYWTLGLKNSEEMRAIFVGLSDSMKDLTDGMSLETSRVNVINQNTNEGQKRMILFQKVLERIGKKLDTYNTKLRLDIAALKVMTESSISYLSTAIVENYQFYPIQSDEVGELVRLRDSFLILYSASNGAINGISAFKDSLQHFPNYQVDFNKARKDSVNLLTEVIGIIERFKAKTLTSFSEISALLSKYGY